jgi:hypothetical protein
MGAMRLLRSTLPAGLLLVPALATAQPAPPGAPPPSAAPPPGAEQPPGAVPPGAYPYPPAYAPYGAYPPGPYAPYYSPMPWLAGHTKTHSPALMGGGIALVVLGALSVIGSATAFAEDASSHARGVVAIIVGLPLAIHGAGCFAGGIPMIVIGNRKIPADGSPPPKTSLVPTIVPSRGGVGLGWSL